MGGLAGVFVLQMFSVILIFVTGIVFDAFDFESIFSSIFTLYYPQLFFVFFYMIITLPDKQLSQLIILVAFAAAAMTDVFAYFIGKFYGQKKLCPNISPNKTVEGALGGLLGGILGVLIIALLMDNGRVHLVEYAVFAVLLSILAQIGDLAASVVKRRYNVKDFGSILPGTAVFWTAWTARCSSCPSFLCSISCISIYKRKKFEKKENCDFGIHGVHRC